MKVLFGILEVNVITTDATCTRHFSRTRWSLAGAGNQAHALRFVVRRFAVPNATQGWIHIASV